MDKSPRTNKSRVLIVVEERIGDGEIIITLKDTLVVEAITLAMHFAMFAFDVVKLKEKGKIILLQERIEIYENYTNVLMENTQLRKQVQKQGIPPPPMVIQQTKSSQEMEEINSLRKENIDLKQQLQGKDQQILSIESMAKDKVITMIRGTLSFLFKSILNKIKEVYHSFSILFEGAI